MRLGRILLLVALVIVIGLGGWWFLGQNGSDSGPSGQQQPVVVETVPVVFLVQPVSRGETIPPEKLAITDLPKSNVPQVYFSDLGEVIGRIASFDLQQGTFITQSMIVENPVDLIGTNIGSDHAAMIPAGMVAFPIPINRFSSLAYGLSRGDRVNVIVTLAMVDMDTQFQSILPNFTAGVIEAQASMEGVEPLKLPAGSFNNLVAQSWSTGSESMSVAGRGEQDSIISQPFYYIPSETQRSRLVSQTVLQNIVVLNLGNFPVTNEEGEEVQLVTPTPEGFEQGEGEAPPGPTKLPPDIITLIMWPQDAVTLNFLIYSGAELTLALRSAGDDTQALTDAVTLQYLMDVYRIPLPSKLPYGLQPGLNELEAPVLENDKPEEIIIR
jgi:pilus assembly protein CpaB